MDIVGEQFQDLFEIRHNHDEVKVGKVLIAEPFLQGNYFNRSVVYMVEHDETGSVGFVLNKRLPYVTSDLVQELEGIHFPVYLGGPMERDQLYYLHCRADIEGALKVATDVYWGGNFKFLVDMLRTERISSEEIRFFAGYSGWGANQLQGELEEGSWLIGDMDAGILFRNKDKNLWEQSMRALGGRYKIWANFPRDPIMN